MAAYPPLTDGADIFVCAVEPPKRFGEKDDWTGHFPIHLVAPDGVSAGPEEVWPRQHGKTRVRFGARVESLGPVNLASVTVKPVDISDSNKLNLLASPPIPMSLPPKAWVLISQHLKESQGDQVSGPAIVGPVVTKKGVWGTSGPCPSASCSSRPFPFRSALRSASTPTRSTCRARPESRPGQAGR